jgi:glycosyltransferase involved in cell wall biosynthesis
MHVVFVDTTLTTAPTGGGQTFLISLVQALTQRNWRVSVVTQTGRYRAIQQALAIAGAEIIEDLWDVIHLPEERAERLARWVNSSGASVYVVSISPDAGWLALPLLAPSIATVSIAHNDVWAFYGPLTHYHPFIDCAIGVSEETHRRIIAESGVPAERARQIPYGIDPLSSKEIASRFSSARRESDPLRVGYVGRLEQAQKRIMDFVPLACELERRGVEFELHLVGDGSDRARLEQEFKRQAPNAPVKFWGWLSPGEVRKRLSELDVFLLMSDCEGLPVALLEAMGHGLAPVVSRTASGNAQLVRDGENGFLVEVGDVVTFAKRLEALAHDELLLRSLMTGAWKTGCDYSTERMVERYITCFGEITVSGFSREHRDALPVPYPLMASCTSPYPIWMRKMKRRVISALNKIRTASW